MSTPYELVTDWNMKWYSTKVGGWRYGVPVAYCPNPDEQDPDYRERYVTTTQGMAFLGKDRDGDEAAMIRLNDYGELRGQARLDHLEVLEEVVEQIRQMRKPDGDEAIQHNPECPDCYIEMNWDEGFDCPACLTHFDDNCTFSHRVCVEYECSEWGELVGADGQPRCVDCTTQVLTGEQSPFSPYDCKRCGKTAVGIPARSTAAKNRLCGGCEGARQRQSFLDDIMGRRV